MHIKEGSVSHQVIIGDHHRFISCWLYPAGIKRRWTLSRSRCFVKWTNGKRMEDLAENGFQFVSC